MTSPTVPMSARPPSAAGARLAPLHTTAVAATAGTAPAAVPAHSTADAGSTTAPAAAAATVPPPLTPSPAPAPTAPVLPASPTSLARTRSPKSRVGTRRGSTASDAGSTHAGGGGGGGAGGGRFNFAQASQHSAAATSIPAPPCASCAARRFHADTAAAASLDDYLRLQTEQSTRGLEVVYGLKIELSKFIEEMADRFPCGGPGGGGPGGGPGGASFQALAAPTAGIVPGIPALPYRVVGYGGMEWWEDVRAGKIKPPTREDDADSNSSGNPIHDPAASNPHSSSSGSGGHANGRVRAMDPFSTHLPSFSAPPPPLTPESVLPSYVLLNRLKLGVRQTLNAMEDGLESLRSKLRASEQAREELQAKLDRINSARGQGGGGAIVVASNSALDFQSFDADTGMMVALSPMAADADSAVGVSGRSFSFAQPGGGSSPSSSAAASGATTSKAGRTRSRSRSRSRVQFATDEFVNTSVQAAFLQPPLSTSSSGASASPPHSSAHDPPVSPTGEGGGLFASAAQLVFNRTAAGQNSVSNRILNQQIAMHAAAATAAAGGESARDYSARSAGSASGSGSGSGSAMDSFRSLPSSGNVSREEALSSALAAAESSLVRWKARARSLADAAHLADLAHTKELSALSQQLVASKLRVSSDAKILTQRNVLLQLERIARRERHKHLEGQHEFFAGALEDYIGEIKELFSTKRQRLFVRKAPNPVTQTQQQHQQHHLSLSKDGSGATNILVLHDGSTPTPKRGASAAGSRKKSLASAARTPGASTPALLASDQPSAAAESTDESGSSSSSTALVRVNPVFGVPDSAVAAGLYPSQSSPLSALERSAKTPAGARWLGKMLSPPSNAAGLERDTLVVSSAVPADKKSESSGPLQGHLVPGADVLALDILLVVDALFLLEYTALSASSVAHSRDLKFRQDLDARRAKLENEGAEDQLQGYLKGGGTRVTIANQTGLSIGTGEQPMAEPPGNHSATHLHGGVHDTREWFDGAPSPAALAALISSIPPQSLSYLQALQKLFLTLWARLPASVQSKFVKIKQNSPANRGARVQQQEAAATTAAEAPPPPVDLLNPRLREAIQSQSVGGIPVCASPYAGAAKDDAAPGADAEDPTTASVVSAVSSSPPVVAAKAAVSHASYRASLRLQFLVDDLRAAHTLGAGPPSANTVGEHHRPANLMEPRQQRLEQAEEGFGRNLSAGPAAAANNANTQQLSSDGFTSALVRLFDAPTVTASGKLSSSLPVPPLVDSFAPESGAPSAADVSLYLARLELILHKVQSLANFRGVMMQM